VFAENINVGVQVKLMALMVSGAPVIFLSRDPKHSEGVLLYLFG
jgi:hypothetical protein